MCAIDLCVLLLCFFFHSVSFLSAFSLFCQINSKRYIDSNLMEKMTWNASLSIRLLLLMMKIANSKTSMMLNIFKYHVMLWCLCIYNHFFFATAHVKYTFFLPLFSFELCTNYRSVYDRICLKFYLLFSFHDIPTKCVYICVLLIFFIFCFSGEKKTMRRTIDSSKLKATDTHTHIWMKWIAKQEHDNFGALVLSLSYA